MRLKSFFSLLYAPWKAALSHINNQPKNVIAAYPTVFEDVCDMPMNQVSEHDSQLIAYSTPSKAINVDKLKLFKPSMLDEKPLQSFPSLDKLGNEQKKMLSKATIVERKSWPTRSFERKLHRTGMKGQLPSHAK
ncbi:hypothetical protein Tco_0416903 [Tanacetum coccineum]